MDVAVFMSGGIDSSVAAFILKEEGYNIVGVTLDMHPFSKESIRKAKLISKRLNINHIVLDVRADFQKGVIEYLINEYINGKTPNPCVICNRRIKFGLAMERLKFERFATGHYVRTSFQDGWVLKKGIDQDKDQSYFLAMIEKKRIKNLIFPLGNLKKEIVKTMAREINVYTDERSESQDLCFIDRNYSEFISNITDKTSGNIVDMEGNVIGRHNGIIHYTIGQRRRIGKPYKHPYYVIKIDTQNNRLIVGKDEDLYSKVLFVERPNWLSIKPSKEPINLYVKIRYRHKPVRAIFYPEHNMVEFVSVQRAITPGQVAAFYDGEILLGGGWISST